MRDAELDSMSFPSAEFRRWHRTLPPQWRRAPEAALAAGIDIQARAPMEALRTFEEAARGFRAAGNGDLQRAYDELDAASGLRVGMPAPELEIARLRIDWLRGDVDHVCAQLLDFKTHYQDTGHRYLLTEVTLELTAKMAWLGELQSARELLAPLEPILADMPGAL